MLTFDQVWQSAQNVEGWMTEAQGRRLYEAARSLGAGDLAVEIGSHHGRSSIVIAGALPDGARLVCVDPFDDPRWGGGPESRQRFSSNVEAAGVADRIEMRQGISATVFQQWGATEIAMLYIDGAHDYPTVAGDITTWGRHLAPGGSLLIHDAFSSTGVTRAVLRHLLLTSRYDYVGAVRSLVELRVSPSRWHRQALLATRLVYFGRNLLVKVAIRRQWPVVGRVFGHPGIEMPY